MIDPQYVWVKTKASKSSKKEFYFYNVLTRKTVWDEPTDNKLNMIVTQEEYADMIKSGDLPRPKNTAEKDHAEIKKEQNENTVSISRKI